MSARYHGQRVIVYDKQGRYEFRGKIMGTHKIVGGDSIFDVQPDGYGTLARRVCCIASSRLRSAGPESSEPIHVKDWA